jgi:hypothetical protein
MGLRYLLDAVGPHRPYALLKLRPPCVPMRLPQANTRPTPIPIDELDASSF